MNRSTDISNSGIPDRSDLPAAFNTPRFDAVQELVLAAAAEGQNLAVIGAPGSGKTALITEIFCRSVDPVKQPAAPFTLSQKTLILSPNRRTATSLRDAVNAKLVSPRAGVFSQTFVAFAFSVLQSAAAHRGELAPTLLTGAVQDELLVESLQHDMTMLPAASRDSLQLRNEVRDLWRVLDAFALPAAELASRVSDSPAVDVETVAKWIAAANSIAAAQRIAEQANRLTAGGILARATELLLSENDVEFELPQRLLIDDAADVTEGQLALLAACAKRGIQVCLFGDPDLAAVSFQGEKTRLLTAPEQELQRKTPGLRVEFQRFVLPRVYRHGEAIRNTLNRIAEGIGVSGTADQRQPRVVDRAAGSVVADTASSFSGEINKIAHQLRKHRLGINGVKPVAWSEMAVICRTRSQAAAIVRELDFQDIPAVMLGGGVVLSENQAVTDLLKQLLAIITGQPLRADFIAELATGPLGRIAKVDYSRLRAAILITERRNSTPGQPVRQVDSVLEELFANPNSFAPDYVDTPAFRSILRLAKLWQRANSQREDKTVRELLWTLWDGAEVATALQQTSLNERGAAKRYADEQLDAVLALFFAIEREEQAEREIGEEFITELLSGELPQDTLAKASQQDTVHVTTPHGVIGESYELVCIAHLADGVWPNLKSRGSLISVPTLESLLRGENPSQNTRRDTAHDELRLLYLAASRAKTTLCFFAEQSENSRPGIFWRLVQQNQVTLPETTLTLRETVALLRRKLEANPGDQETAKQLRVLADAGIPGADPESWYGMRDPGPAATRSVRLSPSALKNAQDCPLSWFISRFRSPGATGSALAVGNLIHKLFEELPETGLSKAYENLREHWEEMPFESEWQSAAELKNAQLMLENLRLYSSTATAEGWEFLAAEVPFEFTVEGVTVRGKIDRVESKPNPDGSLSLRVIDLKTGKSKVSKEDAKSNLQLLSYQTAIAHGEVTEGQNTPAGASLLYPRGNKSDTRDQEALTPEKQQEFTETLQQIAESISGTSFTARIKHHCGQHGGSECEIHLRQAVSYE